MKKNKAFIILLHCALSSFGNFGVAQESVSFNETHTFPFLNVVKTFTQQGNGPFQKAISDLIDQLALSPVVIREGMDAEKRPLFLNAQADFEQSIVYGLKTQKITNAICIIHMPAPDTPLCTNEEISEGLVDPEFLLTGKKKPHILRDYLKEGGTLISAYPRGARTLRSAEQLAILDELIKNHGDCLQTVELDCTEIPKELIGTTYFITFADEQTAILSLRGYQSNPPADDLWAIWFGPIDDPVIMQRLEEIFSFLDRHGF